MRSGSEKFAFIITQSKKFEFYRGSSSTGKDIFIETDRLILRRYCKEDLQDLFEYLSDAEVVKYEPYRPMSLTEVSKELNERISTDEMIAVVLKATDKLIGNIYLGKRKFESLEIGYVFNKQYWGQGYAKESCEALIGKAFFEGVHRIFAECDPQNENSWRLLESLGLVRETHFQKTLCRKLCKEALQAV